MKTLVSEACELVPPASGRFVLTLLCGWVKMRCNKLESIQSCEFWQELNKTEGWDRCGEREPRTRRAGCHCPQPITCCWTRRLSAICHPVHTGREVQSATHTHKDISLSVAARLHSLLLFQSTYSAAGVHMHSAAVTPRYLCVDSKRHARHAARSIRAHAIKRRQ